MGGIVEKVSDVIVAVGLCWVLVMDGRCGGHQGILTSLSYFVNGELFLIVITSYLLSLNHTYSHYVILIHSIQSQLFYELTLSANLFQSTITQQFPPTVSLSFPSRLHSTILNSSGS